MGQKQPVQVFLLVTEQTLEEGMLRTLSLKQDLALAALDVDSDVDAVHLARNAEDLKRRLEVLLGCKPDAPVDESEKSRQSQEAERLARREKVAAAGGQLLAAGFTLLGELLGAKGAAEPLPAVTEAIKRHLADCIERDEQGRSKLSVLLPDDSLLDRIAETLSRLVRDN
jgi:hypothetical protein